MRLLLAFTALTLLAVPVSAEESGRYLLSASPAGFVRLDTVTGDVSHCRQQKGMWSCEVLAVEKSRLDALAAEVAKLSAAVAAIKGRPEAEPPAAEEKSPGFARQMVSRLIGLVRVLKYGRTATPSGT